MAALKTLVPAAALALLVAGCAGWPAQETRPRYTCEHGMAFVVRFVDDTAVLDGGPQGRDLLLRDAGGLTPQQQVYSSPRMRAEFGLGASGREARLHYPLLPLTVRCVRD
ncbi:hypothetical protein [uncultured Ramlibacter sp.]|uniref:hypothetical protein n=1 Tax=uncultured Ramlibacter sp. TaxID=260755 RepID=UPI00260945F0|nr:hypothetical protein [uncultured Ramlibacter sp.]